MIKNYRKANFKKIENIIIDQLQASIMNSLTLPKLNIQGEFEKVKRGRGGRLGGGNMKQGGGNHSKLLCLLPLSIIGFGYLRALFWACANFNSQ